MKLSWILAITLLLLLTMPMAAQETAGDPAVARSLEILQSLVGAHRFADEKELTKQWINALQQEFGPGHSAILNSLSVAGHSFFEQGAYAVAASMFEEQVELSTKVLGAEHPSTLIALDNLAVTLKAQGDLVGARQHQEKVLEALRRILGTDHPDTLVSLSNLAGTLKAQGDLIGARQRYEEVLEALRRIHGNEHSNTLTALANLAGILYAQGDLAGAHQLEEEVLESRSRILGAEHPGTLNALANLADTLRAQGDLVGARQRLEKALEAFRRTLGAEHPDTLNTLNNLASTLEDQGNLVGAQQRYEEALKARRKILGPDHPHTLITLGGLAGTLYSQGNLVSARQRFEEVLESRNRILGAKHPDTLTALANLAEVLYAQGDLMGARERQEQVLETRRRLLGDEHPDTLTALSNLARTLYAQGNLVGARKHIEEVLEARSRIMGAEHPQTLVVLSNLAGTVKAQGDLIGARQRWEEVLEARRRILDPEHPDTLRTMHNLGATLKDMGALDQAQRLFEQVVDIQIRNRKDGRSEKIESTETLFGLAEIHRDAGRLEEASRFFNAAVDALEKQADRFDLSEDVKSHFRSDKSNGYHATIEVALRLNKAEEAFHTLERYRAQSLLTLLRWGQPPDAEVATNGSARDEVAQRSDEILYELNQLDPETDRDRRFALLAERSQLQRQRETLWYQRMQGRREGQKLTVLQVDEIRLRLDPGTLLLAFHVTNDGIDLFVLTHDGPLELHRLPVTMPELRWQIETRYLPRLLSIGDASAPESLEEDFEGATGADDPDAVIDPESWLYNRLLAPAEKRLAASNRLLILPDGPLYYLPFAALKRDTRDDPRGWQYLVEWKPIHIAQSATVYAELQQQRPANGEMETQPTLVALGDPSYPMTTEVSPQRGERRTAGGQALSVARSVVEKDFFQSLAPLPKTASEVLGIAALFPIGRAHPLLGIDATEERAKQVLATASYVHLAAHGFADTENALDSFLALAIPLGPSTDLDNGILEAWEVIDHLRLDADLVVLSACVTALGSELGGEGLMSLSRAFQIAGARTVAASLWRVEDESTAELMIRFYRHLIQDGMPKDEALRAAQMELIRGPIPVELEDGTVVGRDFSAPYHWAAFQLIGDWQ